MNHTADTTAGRHAQPTSRIRRTARILIPAFIIIAWLAGAAVGGPYFGRVDEVSSNDQTSYLPDSADATEVQALLGEFNDSESIPAVVIFVGDGTLTDSQIDTIGEALDHAAVLDGIDGDISPGLPSDDGRAVQAFIPISSDADIADVVGELSSELRSAAPDGVTVMEDYVRSLHALFDRLEAFPAVTLKSLFCRRKCCR
ncbi:MAG TPA: hypothetical protein PK890_09695, partial [Terrimesophilobacter sp.]|nr:hypothetical protein [Terrimesophilobacter sp.]